MFGVAGDGGSAMVRVGLGDAKIAQYKSDAGS